MTEEQKRAIYEWLYDDLKGRDMRLALCDDRAGHLKPLPPLDMNTWHGPVEEKLAAEGIRVEVCMDSVAGRVLCERGDTADTGGHQGTCGGCRHGRDKHR